MTRAMPGGDGSLEFTLPGREAGRRRNVLRAGAAVILDAGDDQWGGLIVGDPMAGFYAAQPLVAVSASGLWSQAANRRDLGYGWSDSDPTQWFRIRQRYDSGDPDGWVDFEDQGKFTLDTEGRLFLRADADRTFVGYSNASFAYWLDKGLVDCGCRIVGLDIVYKCNLPNTPSQWTMRVRGHVGSPWDCATYGALELDESTSRTSWRTEAIDLSAPATSLTMRLGTGSGGGSPASDPYSKIKSVIVHCRGGVGAVDRSITLDDAMCDLAQLPGLATVVRASTIGAPRGQLMLRSEGERSVADGIRELSSMHPAAVEHFFDRTGNAWRFTCNEVPAVVDPTRNRHWAIDDSRAGEDTSGVMRDPEAAPEYMRVLYRSSGVTGLPDGQPRSYCYPGEPTDFVSNVAVYTDKADVKMTDAQAADVAAQLHAQMNTASLAGTITLPDTALTVTGQELPSRLIRPGDRVNILGRDGATDLYVSETSYDWASGQMSVTVGWPFEIVAR
jgi:hypothetical protein